jgi:predicted phage tail protein
MVRSRALCPLILAVLAACGSDPSGPSTGSLAVAVSGLPAGTSAAVTVTGPGGYTRDLGGTETLSGLTPGSYTVTAEAVSSSGQSYEPSQATQSIAVAEGATPASAQVIYGLVTASLTVTIAGLPPGTSGAVTVTGPAGYSQSVTGTTTLSGLAAGVYTVTAQSVSPAGTQYDPSPSSQTANLAPGGSATANVSYTQASSGGLNLRIDGMYLTQSVQ